MINIRLTAAIALFVSIVPLEAKVPTHKMISSLDSPSPLKGWRVRPNSGVDFSLTNCKQFDSTRAIKVKFSKSSKPEKQVLFFNFDHSQKDWRKYEAFELDLFCSNPSKYKMTLCGPRHKTAYMFVPELKKGKQHYVIALDRIRDSSKMSYLYFYHYTPSPTMTLCIKNLKLVDYTEPRIEKIINIIKKLNAIIPAHKNYLLKLQKQIESIQGKYSLNLSYKNWKSCIDDIDKIRLNTARLINKSMSDNLLIAEKAAFLYDLNFTCKRIDSSYVYTHAEKATSKLEKEKFINKTLKNYQKYSVIKEKINNKFSNEDFAIGISEVPVYLSDYPQSFNGNFTKSIQLYSARRECEPFQLILMTKNKAMKNVTITVSDLTGGKRIINSNNIEIAPMGWRLDYDSVFKADMLRPDIKKFNVKVNHQQPVWVNVFVPKNTLPGDYSGELKVSADGMKTQSVKLKLKVWPFELPQYASLKNAIGIVRQTGPKGLALSKIVNNHRFNYSNIYEYRQTPLKERESNLKRGTFMFNLLRCKNRPSHLEERFFKQADAMFKEMKEKNPDLLKRCYVYGFDEVQVKSVPKMEKVFGKVKRHYDNIKTMCAINKPLWKYYPNLKNLDIWVLTLNLLTPEIKSMLETSGHEVWWYNLCAKSNEPLSCRIQFWGTYKDKLSGVLFYNLKAGSVGRYQNTLYPTVKRTKDGAFNLFGVLRENHKGYPISSVAFECWREGMEDHDYFVILKNLKNKLIQQNKHPDLVNKAEKLLNIPDNITKGIMVGGTTNSRDSCIYEKFTSDSDLNDLLQYRKKLGKVITEIYESLKND